MTTRSMVLLVAGAVLLAKSVWALGWPSSVPKLTRAWVAAIRPLARVVSWILLAAGVWVWVVLFRHQPVANALLMLVGLALLAGAAVHRSPASLQRWSGLLLSGRPVWATRLAALVGLALAVFMIWTAGRTR